MRYRLDRSDNKRTPCPGCGHVGTYRHYMDIETGERLGEEVGMCDRINNCGYHKTPSMHLREHGGQQEYRHERPLPPPPPRDTSWRCPPDIVALTGDHRWNVFAHWLCSLHPGAAHWLREYRVGTYPPSERNPHLTGAMVYWQVGEDDLPRSGKIIAYGPDGKRIKEHKAAWVHSVVYGRSMDELGIGQALFGTHLLKRRPSAPVAIVESEKTAIICATLYPDHVWLATGGVNNLSASLCMCLSGRDVTMFPDQGCLDLWRQKAAVIEPLMSSLEVSDIMECIGAADGEDIADYLLTVHDGEPFNYIESMCIDLFPHKAPMKPEVEAAIAMYDTGSANPPALERMIRRNPAVGALVNELQLDTANITIL